MSSHCCSIGMRVLHPRANPTVHCGETVRRSLRSVSTSGSRPGTNANNDKSAVVGFVRSYGKILAEEHITFNAVCPNKIRTGISTAASYEKAEKAGVLVPMGDLLDAFEMLLAQGKHKDLSGECLEVAPKVGVRVVKEWVPFVNEESRLSAEMTYHRSHYLHEVVDD